MSEQNEAPAKPEPYLCPIDDGQTRTSVIPAEAGRWSAVRLNWRLLTADDKAVIDVRIALDPEGGDCKQYAEVLAGNPKQAVPAKILGWDIRDATNKTIPVTADAIRRMSPGFYARLVDVVSGYRPEWETPPRTENPEKN